MNGSVYPSLENIAVPRPLLFTKVACGRKHVVALMEGGYVFSWGMGYFGQLGHGDDSSWETPKNIKTLDPKKLGNKVVSVVCGGSHSGVITQNGHVLMWGLNRNGQTGTGSKADSLLEPRPLETGEMQNRAVKQLVCGRNHSCLLTTDGRVYSWGAAGFGR